MTVFLFLVAFALAGVCYGLWMAVPGVGHMFVLACLLVAAALAAAGSAHLHWFARVLGGLGCAGVALLTRSGYLWLRARAVGRQS